MTINVTLNECIYVYNNCTELLAEASDLKCFTNVVQVWLDLLELLLPPMLTDNSNDKHSWDWC